MALARGAEVDARIPWVRRLVDLDAAWAERSPGKRTRELVRHGERLGDALRSGPRVVAVRTLPLTSLIYPTKHAFNSTVPLPVPYVEMTHRCLLVQVRVEREVKNILFNPTDVTASRATPFFRKIIERFGERGTELLRKKFPPIEAQLAELGLEPSDIDLIAFDHFHTQDVRPLLGTDVPTHAGGPLPARFPNAYLLAPENEWEAWADLHPMQRAWFIAEGRDGVPEDRVVLTDSDLVLGDGCLLLRTPGHTVGNQTLFVNADSGVFGCSENGCSADNWTPFESKLPGLAGYARHYEVEVILNANTPEWGGDQYASMLLEKSVVSRVPDAPGFVQMFPSSEVTPSLLAPGIRPGMVFGGRTSGEVVRPSSTSRAGARARA